MQLVEDEATREEQPGTGKLRGNDPGIVSGTNLGRSGWVTTAVAAAALGVSPRRVRTLIKNGDLEAVANGEGVNKVYSVSIASLESLRDQRTSGRGSSAERYRSSSPEETQGGTSPEHMADVIRELAGRLETRAASEAELRTRLELTAKAESTLREELARERERADTERERADRLEAELREARKPPPATRDAPETATEGESGNETPTVDTGEPRASSWWPKMMFGREEHHHSDTEQPRRSSWWRRFFGFE